MHTKAILRWTAALLLAATAAAAQNDPAAAMRAAGIEPPSPSSAPPAAGTPGTAPAGEEYSLRLDRPLQVGEKHRIRATGRVEWSFDMSLSLTPQQPASPLDFDGTYTIDFDAVREVLAVDSLGRPTREAYTIARCTRMSKSGETTEVLRPGDVVTATLAGDGSTAFEPRSGKLKRKARQALATVISLPAGASDDEIFATGTPRHVGESWAVDTAALADDFIRSGMGVSESDLAGRVTLVGEKVQDGVQGIEVKAEIAAQNVVVPGDGQGTLKAAFSGIYPLDPTRQPLRERLEMDVSSSASGGNASAGFAANFGQHRKTVTSRTITPVQ